MKTRKFGAILLSILVVVIVFSMIPIFSVSADSTSATKVTSLSEVTEGEYVIAAKVDGTYYALTGYNGGKGIATQFIPNGDTIADASTLTATFTAVDGETNTFTQLQGGAASNMVVSSNTSNWRWWTDTLSWDLYYGTATGIITPVVFWYLQTFRKY